MHSKCHCAHISLKVRIGLTGLSCNRRYYCLVIPSFTGMSTRFDEQTLTMLESHHPIHFLLRPVTVSGDTGHKTSPTCTSFVAQIQTINN